MTNPLQVKFADGEQERLEHKLFVGMVPKTATEDDVMRVFAPFGRVEEIMIHRGVDGMPKGAAFVKYSTRDEANEAIIRLNGHYKMEVFAGLAPSTHSITHSLFVMAGRSHNTSCQIR